MLIADDGPVCPCGRPATANGRECPAHFRERLRSIRLDTSVTPNRTRENYYDRESIRDQFGEDAHERMMDATKGLGPGTNATDQEISDVYLGGPIVGEDVS